MKKRSRSDGKPKKHLVWEMEVTRVNQVKLKNRNCK
ncbi:hypothetical protein BY457_11464 [Marinilabilia salmonicolor]|jgi:hypothetical protein|nr:hypothetical protein BY457_11464 [Marinilabilia salmonicolor]